MNWRILGVVFFLLLFLPQAAFAATDRQVKMTSFSYTFIPETEYDPGVLRMEIGLNRATENFRLVQMAENSSQIVVEFGNAKIGRLKKPVKIDHDLANLISFEQKGKKEVKVRISLPYQAKEAEYKVYTLPEDRKQKKPFRVVIDLMKAKVYDFNTGLAGKTILIDPGHGGSDPGAAGPTGVREKDVNFGVAQKVEKILKDAGARVIMTRSSDRDVYGPKASDKQELQARVNVAMTNKADVFVSIHSNSFTSPNAHGTQTFYYEKTKYDRMLAQHLQSGLVAHGGLADRGVTEANFYVVKRAPIPAALVELAFISNPEEERLLGTYDFQQKLAEGICEGLSDYFAQAAGEKGK